VFAGLGRLVPAAELPGTIGSCERAFLHAVRRCDHFVRKRIHNW